MPVCRTCRHAGEDCSIRVLESGAISCGQYLVGCEYCDYEVCPGEGYCPPANTGDTE